MSVLLVEDEAPKLAHIERHLRKLGPEITLRVARSVNSALDELEYSRPDLLLLDMSLPTFDVGDRESGGRPQGFGGIEVLRNMVLAGVECPVVVITGYEAFPRRAGQPVDLTQLRTELMQEFSHFLLGVLHYNSTYDEWKTELGRTLAKFLNGPGESI